MLYLGINPSGPPKLKATKGNMDALPTYSLSQLVPCTSVYLYHVGRQGAP